MGDSETKLTGTTVNVSEQRNNPKSLNIGGFTALPCFLAFAGISGFSAFTRQGSLVRSQLRPPKKARISGT
jgi:hypothetical protein